MSDSAPRERNLRRKGSDLGVLSHNQPQRRSTAPEWCGAGTPGSRRGATSCDAGREGRIGSRSHHPWGSRDMTYGRHHSHTSRTADPPWMRRQASPQLKDAAGHIDQRASLGVRVVSTVDHHHRVSSSSAVGFIPGRFRDVILHQQPGSRHGRLCLRDSRR